MKGVIVWISFAFAVLGTALQLVLQVVPDALPVLTLACAWTGIATDDGMPRNMRNRMMLGGFMLMVTMATLVGWLSLVPSAMPAPDSIWRLALLVVASAPVLMVAYAAHESPAPVVEPELPDPVRARIMPMPWGSDVILSIGDEGEHGVQIVGPRERLEAVARLLSEDRAS